MSNIHHQVTFECTYFTPLPDEEELTNAGRFGKMLAEWLAGKLTERGFRIEEILPEDFGWVVMLSRKPFPLWLGCGNIDGTMTQWTVIIVAELNWLQRVFKHPDPTDLIAELMRHVSELVPSIPGVSRIRFE